MFWPGALAGFAAGVIVTFAACLIVMKALAGRYQRGDDARGG